jgi:hypothetical protein
MSWTSVLMSPNGLRSTFIILSVAFLLTIYELSSFYIVIVPIIKQKLADGIGKVGESINDIVSKYNLVLPKTKFNTILQVFDEREQLLLDNINTYTKYTGAIILVVIIFSLLFIRQLLQHQGLNIARGTYTNILVTIILIGIFQYSFFNYGQKYNYIGSYGQEELNGYLLENIKV